jgi:hypothetical protein
VLSGEHSFHFEPSKTTPGGTTFHNDGASMRLSVLVMMLWPDTKMFKQCCVDFKARVEKVKAEGAFQSKETA